jgi:hypothetical protein
MSFELSDLDERVSEALAHYARPADPENYTEADLASLLGQNWRNVIVVLEAGGQPHPGAGGEDRRLPPGAELGTRRR